MKFISLLSSGIDSPVATYLMSKKANEIILLHADNRPFTDDREIKNFERIAEHLSKIMSCTAKSYVIKHGNSLSEFKKSCDTKFTCVFCKRMLLKYSEKLAMEEKADAVIMGDSLGQVASQTLRNIRTIEDGIEIPVIRPLIGYDKEEIIKIAKEIETYELSIKKSHGCTAVPNSPSTQAKIEKIILEEEKIDSDLIIEEAIKNVKILSF